MKATYCIGIDPGVQTGLAVWNREEKRLMIVRTGTRVKAEIQVLNLHFHAQTEGKTVLVRFEDARLRKWFGNTGKEVWKGAGSIMRDSQLWEEFCEEYGIKYQKVAPKDNSTKLNAQTFGKLTGWTDRTSEHARDAAMLVFKI